MLENHWHDLIWLNGSPAQGGPCISPERHDNEDMLM